MKKEIRILLVVGVVMAVIGCILSGILILEYFEPGNKIGGTLCSANNDISACTKVAVSPYSGFRDIPLLGDIPVALLGFIFYGFAGTVFVLAYRSEESEQNTHLSFLLFTLGLGVVADIGLLIVSMFLIKTVCTLCVYTYFVTFALFGITFVIVQKDGLKMDSIFTGFSKQKVPYFLIVCAFFAVGHIFGNSVKPSHSHSISDESERKKKIENDLKMYGNAPKVDIDTKSYPFAGDKNAPITIVKYADFNCGHCMHTSHILKMILAEYTGIVKVVYKNFPLDGNCNRFVQRLMPDASSCVAASASICADRQGKFMPVYSGIYSDTEKGVMHTISSVTQIASSSGLNMGQFQKCMGSNDTREQILKEVEEAGKLKIESTPSLFVNNKPIPSGTPDVDFLRELIKQLMK
ncbi:MAG: thioredoxin domain-containing protein [Leptospiraceae bacterium]|nr:thioredoxin domain-containing protein [Leptospiraceae bacterium]MCK6380086.1 thioredoxin domain-containing protein [Leptospiraceae bacterium]NUM40473.1 thioredoxin domain-containing protein [Leptospiraceae bacterium]